MLRRQRMSGSERISLSSINTAEQWASYELSNDKEGFRLHISIIRYAGTTVQVQFLYIKVSHMQNLKITIL